MKTFLRFRIWILVIALLVPLLARLFSHYYGLPARRSVETPDYAAYEVPQPPLSTPQEQIVTRSVGEVVVIDYQHGNQFFAYEIETLVEALTVRGAVVELASDGADLGTRMKYASALIVISPMSAYQEYEIARVRDFTAAGGRLVVLTDPTRGALYYDWYSSLPSTQPDTDSVNPLLAAYGIRVQNDYLYNLVENEGNFRNVLLEDFASGPLTSGLERVAFYGSHSLTALGGTELIRGDANTVSSLDDTAGPGRAAAVLSADGSVLAVGDFSYLQSPYDAVAGNPQWIGRIADFALGGERVHALADFPYLFDRDVSVMLTGGLQLNADLLSPLGNLQSALAPLDLTVLSDSDDWNDGDLLVLGTLTSSEDLDLFTASFELDLQDPETISLPGFGRISRSGIGLLLYGSGDVQNRVVLLAETPENLPALIDLLASGYLYACMIQGRTGVCSLGPGGSYYAAGLEDPFLDDYLFDFYDPYMEYPEGTPTPVGP